MASGDLLTECVLESDSRKFLACNSSGDKKGTVSVHRTLNTRKGVISLMDLMDAEESEILENLCPQGATEVRRINYSKDGKTLKTGHIVLTFNGTVLPGRTKMGYLTSEVRPYVPNPRRCFACNRYGHSSTSCRGKHCCAKCCSTNYESTDCNSPFSCVNFQDDHLAYSRSCPKWQHEKQILELKM